MESDEIGFREKFFSRKGINNFVSKISIILKRVRIILRIIIIYYVIYLTQNNPAGAEGLRSLIDRLTGVFVLRLRRRENSSFFGVAGAYCQRPTGLFAPFVY